MRLRVIRLLAVAVLTGWMLVGAAAPALAHGRGSDATNFRSEILDAPAIDGVTWRVYGGDELLEVTNTGDSQVLVHGYDGEPYLRVEPEGVFHNVRSPATYINTERLLIEPPAVADSGAEPEWEQVSSGRSYAWHDHRIHWMSPVLPPVVIDQGERTLVQEWTVAFSVDGSEQQLAGELWWIPGPSPWPWLAVGLVVVLPVLAGLRTEPVDDERWPGLARPAAVVLAAVAVLNLTHLVDDFLAVPLPWSTVLLAAFQTGLFVAIGMFGAIRGWQAREGAFTALGVGAGAMFVGQGLLYFSILGASQIATLFPDAVARLAVAVSLAQILPIGVVAFVGTRRLLPDYDEAPAEVADTAP